MPLGQSHRGTSLKTFFTISVGGRYDCAMLLLAAAAIAASAPDNTARTPAIVQARATVQIVVGARLHWDQAQQTNDVPPARTTVVHTVDGPQPAKLIEFE